MNKVKEYLKGKNPYLMASFAVVLASVLAIYFLLQVEGPAGEKEDVVIETLTSEPKESISEETVVSTESERTEDVETKNTENEEPDASVEAGGTEEESTAGDEEQSKQSIVFEPQDSSETVESSVEKVVAKETEEAEPKSEKIPAPEPERIPEPGPDVIPEESNEPEVLPEESSEPDTHEHSWIFDSFYQKPTCSNGGLENQICAHCGETQTTIGTPTGKHIYEVESVGDCCSAEVVICKECNHRETREMDSKNHIDVEDGFCYGCGNKAD